LSLSTYEGMQGSRDIAQPILNADATWRHTVNIVPLLLTSRIECQYPLNRRLGRPQRRLE